MLVHLRLLLGLCWLLVVAASKNITIDDTNGDGNGYYPSYSPARLWQSHTCTKGCPIRPDPSQAFQETWTQIFYKSKIMPEASVQVNFHGSAIYMFFILDDSIIPGVPTETLCNFTLDGQLEASFHHEPQNETGLSYNQLVYSHSGLAPDIPHTLVASTFSQEKDLWMAFDFAIVTLDGSPQPQILPEDGDGDDVSGGRSNNTSTAVGSIFGFLAFVCIAFFIYFVLRRRRHRDWARKSRDPTEAAPFSQFQAQLGRVQSTTSSSPSSQSSPSMSNAPPMRTLPISSGYAPSSTSEGLSSDAATTYNLRDVASTSSPPTAASPPSAFDRSISYPESTRHSTAPTTSDQTFVSTYPLTHTLMEMQQRELDAQTDDAEKAYLRAKVEALQLQIQEMQQSEPSKEPVPQLPTPAHLSGTTLPRYRQ